MVTHHVRFVRGRGRRRTERVSFVVHGRIRVSGPAALRRDRGPLFGVAAAVALALAPAVAVAVAVALVLVLAVVVALVMGILLRVRLRLEGLRLGLRPEVGWRQIVKECFFLFHGKLGTFVTTLPSTFDPAQYAIPILKPTEASSGCDTR